MNKGSWITCGKSGREIEGRRNRRRKTKNEERKKGDTNNIPTCCQPATSLTTGELGKTISNQIQEGMMAERYSLYVSRSQWLLTHSCYRLRSRVKNRIRLATNILSGLIRVLAKWIQPRLLCESFHGCSAERLCCSFSFFLLIKGKRGKSRSDTLNW